MFPTASTFKIDMRKIFENQLSEMDVSPFNSLASHVSVHNARDI